MTLEEIRALVAGDLNALDGLMQARLRSQVVLVNQLGQYIVASGGKRVRPLVCLLSARACGHDRGLQVNLAAIIEFIHTATLLHDDVVDGSELRRGQESANVLFGNEASVLVGDFLYSRAFQMMVEVGSMRIMEILAHATNVIAEGEVLQLMGCHDPDVTEARYLEVIVAKTAMLFEAAARVGAVLGQRPATEEDGLARYGRHLGIAFQLVDDALDYDGSVEHIGKNIGDDLAEGKVTLPLIHALRHGSESQRSLLRAAIEEGGRDRIEPVLEAVVETGAIAYTKGLAQDHGRLALDALAAVPPSREREALASLASFSVERDH